MRGEIRTEKVCESARRCQRPNKENLMSMETSRLLSSASLEKVARLQGESYPHRPWFMISNIERNKTLI